MSGKGGSKDSLNANASSESSELTNAENTDSPSAENSNGNSESKNTENSVKRMGVVRFLQIVPQKSGTAAILRSRYASQVHTQKEWEAIVAEILNRKVK